MYWIRKALTAAAVAAAALTAGAEAQTESATPGWIADGVEGTFEYEFSRRLYHESLVSARDFAVAEAAIGQKAEFAHGITLFLAAVEGLSADLSRHGLRRDDILGLPFVRLFVPPAAEETPITYEGFRAILQRFVDRLAEAEPILANIDDQDIVLPLRPAGPRLDLNGDGTYASGERLLPILMQVVDPFTIPDQAYWEEADRQADEFVDRLAVADPAALAALDEISPIFGFDRGDAAWLAGYAHLLSALAEFFLAYDFEASFDHSFFIFFPGGDFPYPELAETYRRPGFSPLLGGDLTGMALITDIAAFAVHSPWDVEHPQKLKSVREHLLRMIAFSRRSWTFIESETDNLSFGTTENVTYPEWIPSPGQASTPGFPAVTRDVLFGWRQFLDAFEDVLKGELLVPHWRFDEGLNLRRMFEEPRPLSPIELVQGSDALPYLENGPLADGAVMVPIMMLLGGDFLTYMIWFN